MFEAVRRPVESDTCFIVETVEAIVSNQSCLTDPLEASVVQVIHKNWEKRSGSM